LFIGSNPVIGYMHSVSLLSESNFGVGFIRARLAIQSESCDVLRHIDYAPTFVGYQFTLKLRVEASLSHHDIYRSV